LLGSHYLLAARRSTMSLYNEQDYDEEGNGRYGQVEVQAEQLLSQLSLEEKLNMMDGDTPLWAGFMEMTAGGYADHPWPAGVVPRLGIPGILFADGPRGVILEGATTFPVSMARGASWDVELEKRIGDVIGRELRALGGNFFGGICINLLRHPAWGRAQETYGEDPYHLGEFGAALTRGVQQHVMACAKHFALNSMENARFKVNVQISPRALHELYLPHFKRAVDEGVAAIMSAYNSMNGEWCGQNKVLLTDILKEGWGFEGFVLTDFIFGMRDAKKAALAGQDLEMPFQFHYHQHLRELVESGEVPLAVVDDAVRRLLRRQLALPPAEAYAGEVVASEGNRALAREAAQKSMVLLQNKDGVLPLQEGQKVAVIGRLADMPNTGDGGSSNTRPAYVVTPLQGIQAALKEQAEVLYDDGRDLDQARTVAQAADVVLLVVGYTDEDEGEFVAPDVFQEMTAMFPPPTPEETAAAESFVANMTAADVVAMPPGGDRDQLTLRPEDEALIQAIAAVQPQTVVAVMSGSAVIMEAWREAVAAILMIWYPGMEGGHALADILLGKVNPSGKLPFVVPQRAGDLPFFDKDAAEITYDLWHGYRKLEREGIRPAFPFGFGCSYTRYRYENLKLSQSRLSPSDTLRLTLDVVNEGEMAGEEIVQVYVSAIGSAVERPVKELKAFKRTAVPAADTKAVHLELPMARLAYYDEERQDFIVEAVEYELFAGAHSLDPQGLTARFVVRGATSLT
jgi:beta-glucosidase